MVAIWVEELTPALHRVSTFKTFRQMIRFGERGGLGKWLRLAGANGFAGGV